MPQPAPTRNAVEPATLAILLVRFLALFWIVAGLWQAVGNLADAIFDFDPTYLGFFLHTQLLRPAVAVTLGLLLFWLSGPIGRRLARGLNPVGR